MDPAERAGAAARVRAICLALPAASERLSHGSPAFFAGRRQFATLLSDHHGDSRFALWCAAAPVMQGTLVEADPERFFVPPYVGHRGWIGVRLDRGLGWPELATLLADAHAAVTARVPGARR